MIAPEIGAEIARMLKLAIAWLGLAPVNLTKYSVAQY